jgi:DNA-binding transcriptional ArsR family regulator
MSDQVPPSKSKASSDAAEASPSRPSQPLPGPAGPEIIPVGQEPRRQLPAHGGDHREAAARKIIPGDAVMSNQRKKGRRNLRDPSKFFAVKDRLNALSIFTLETMGTLRRSEIRVWLAIFNCEFEGLARIGYSRLCEITRLSRRHVGTAVKSLEEKGLLEVVFRGRYRPNRSRAGDGCKASDRAGGVKGKDNGLASCYRTHARPAENANAPPPAKPAPRKRQQKPKPR